MKYAAVQKSRRRTAACSCCAVFPKSAEYPFRLNAVRSVFSRSFRRKANPARSLCRRKDSAGSAASAQLRSLSRIQDKTWNLPEQMLRNFHNTYFDLSFQVSMGTVRTGTPLRLKELSQRHFTKCLSSQTQRRRIHPARKTASVSVPVSPCSHLPDRSFRPPRQVPCR